MLFLRVYMHFVYENPHFSMRLFFFPAPLFFAMPLSQMGSH